MRSWCTRCPDASVWGWKVERTGWIPRLGAEYLRIQRVESLTLGGAKAPKLGSATPVAPLTDANTPFRNVPRAERPGIVHGEGECMHKLIG